MIISICSPENTQKHEKYSKRQNLKFMRKVLAVHCFFTFLVANRTTIQNYLYLWNEILIIV
jgi:hypothetical protein